MSTPTAPLAETILRAIAENSPSPWYPATFAETTATVRDSLDSPLNDLRISGLVELTDWVSGKGQGYRITATGREVLKNPSGILKRIADGSRPTPIRVSNPGIRILRGSDRWGQGEAVVQAMTQPIEPKVTRSLLMANLLMYGVGLTIAVVNGYSWDQYLSRPPADVLLKSGALFGRDVISGQFWRLLTCCFVHGSIIHLLVNMVSLVMVGPMCERLWGRWRFLTIYLLAGIGGSTAAVLINPDTLLVGASGAIWGLLGSLVAWVTLNRAHLPPTLIKSWLRSLGFVFLINIAISFSPGISKEAHFGGGAVGFLIASLLHVHRFYRGTWRALSLSIVLLSPLVMVLLVMSPRSKDPISSEIERNINRFAILEPRAWQAAQGEPSQEDRAAIRAELKSIQQELTTLSQKLAQRMRQGFDTDNRLEVLQKMSIVLPYAQFLTSKLSDSKRWNDQSQKLLEQFRDQYLKGPEGFPLDPIRDEPEP